MTEDQISDVRMFKQILNHNMGRKGKHSLSRILIETRMTEPVLDSLLKSEIYANGLGMKCEA